jgi:hypothetical protein
MRRRGATRRAGERAQPRDRAKQFTPAAVARVENFLGVAPGRRARGELAADLLLAGMHPHDPAAA